jgi:hypothetical protein
MIETLRGILFGAVAASHLGIAWPLVPLQKGAVHLAHAL